MTEAEVLAELERVEAVLKGHFELSSGRHSDTYIEKFRALEDPRLATRLGEALADRFASRDIDVVLSPAVGAIVLGFCTAAALDCRFVFAERDSGIMKLRRGFRIASGERVLVVEDVVTTGASVSEVLPLVEPGELSGIGLLANRSEVLDLPVPAEALVKVAARSWDRQDCPLCERGLALEAPGSRRLAGLS